MVILNVLLNIILIMAFPLQYMSIYSAVGNVFSIMVK